MITVHCARYMHDIKTRHGRIDPPKDAPLDSPIHKENPKTLFVAVCQANNVGFQISVT